MSKSEEGYPNIFGEWIHSRWERVKRVTPIFFVSGFIVDEQE